MGVADEAALYALGYWMHENHPTRVDALCLNTIQRKTPCDNCTEACPARLQLHGATPDWRGCTDCGLCVTACPTQAINASGAQCGRIDDAFDAARGCVVLACERYAGSADAVVKCLASLSRDELAAYALRAPLVLKASACKTCPDAAAAACLRNILADLRDFFGADEFARRIFPRIPDHLAAEHAAGLTAGGERRRAISSVSCAGKKGAVRLVDEASEAPTSSRARALLLDALAALPASERPSLTWQTLVEDGQCKGCGICVNMCPHDALSFAVHASDDEASDADDGAADEDPIPRYLVHEASLCTQCGLCYMSCPQDNLGGWEELRTAEVPARRFHGIDVTRCERCGRLFKAAEGKKRCPACSRFRFAPSKA